MVVAAVGANGRKPGKGLVVIRPLLVGSRCGGGSRCCAHLAGLEGGVVGPYVHAVGDGRTGALKHGLRRLGARVLGLRVRILSPVAVAQGVLAKEGVVCRPDLSNVILLLGVVRQRHRQRQGQAEKRSRSASACTTAAWKNTACATCVCVCLLEWGSAKATTAFGGKTARTAAAARPTADLLQAHSGACTFQLLSHCQLGTFTAEPPCGPCCCWLLLPWGRAAAWHAAAAAA